MLFFSRNFNCIWCREYDVPIPFELDWLFVSCEFEISYAWIVMLLDNKRYLCLDAIYINGVRIFSCPQIAYELDYLDLVNQNYVWWWLKRWMHE